MKKESSKSTVLVVSMGFLFLYIVFSWQWAMVVSFVVGVVGILSSYLSRKIEWFWMKLSQILGYIVPNILLTSVFFLFLFPISLLSKLSKKDPLMLSKKYNTYFLDIQKRDVKDSFKKTW
jgi:hypothetical protein